MQHRALARLVGERSNHWYGRDRRYPADYEPSGDDFLSGGLIEAALMKRVVDGCSFSDWWAQFEPARSAIGHWLEPVSISDAHDPKIVHLHGLNLSRLVLAPTAARPRARPTHRRGARDRNAPGRLAAGRDPRRLCRHALARLLCIAGPRRFRELTLRDAKAGMASR
jgi:hypothetical protein